MEIEFTGLCLNGFLMLFVCLLTLAADIACLVGAISWSEQDVTLSALAGILSGVLFIGWLIMLFGFVKLEPNEALVTLFFGKYQGTLRKTGFFYLNPFMSCKYVSLRARNLDATPIKVNDKTGNPIMIGQVIVWRLKDSYKALFDIDAETMAANATASGVTAVNRRMKAFENFVKVQSDAALRQIAGLYAYDETDTHTEGATLRSGTDEINEILEQKLNERLAMAGIEVVEARINYLAYAPEIAAVMLRRQQASAIISAREKIVEGAVSMVKMALEKLDEEKVVTLSEEKKAAMVSNLLVVLCADEPAQPIVNSGSEN